MGLQYKIQCPLCKAKIPSDAVKCSHCAGDLSGKEVQEKIKKQVKRQNMTFGLVGILVILIIFIARGDKNSTSTSTNTPTTEKQTLSIGEEGIINYNTDRNDCSGQAILGISKEAQDKITKASNAKDKIGLAQLVLTGEAFMVDNCTKVKVIDSAMFLRQVRITDGEQFGKAGWLPYEWTVK